VIADESVRNAVANRVDVDEGVVRDSSLEAAAVGRERSSGQRPERTALLALEANHRCLVRRAVDALVRGELPVGEVRLQVLERFEPPPRDGVALHVLHARLGLPLRASAVWPLVGAEEVRIFHGRDLVAVHVRSFEPRHAHADAEQRRRRSLVGSSRRWSTKST
jgi:hypothetical protein